MAKRLLLPQVSSILLLVEEVCQVGVAVDVVAVDVEAVDVEAVDEVEAVAGDEVETEVELLRLNISCRRSLISVNVVLVSLWIEVESTAGNKREVGI